MVEKNKKPIAFEDSFFQAASEIVGENYAHMGEDNCNSSEKKILNLLNQRVMPKEPFDTLTIDKLMNKVALMDSNNFEGSAGIGEREGRIFSDYVK